MLLQWQARLRIDENRSYQCTVDRPQAFEMASWRFIARCATCCVMLREFVNYFVARRNTLKRARRTVKFGVMSRVRLDLATGTIGVVCN